MHQNSDLCASTISFVSDIKIHLKQISESRHYTDKLFVASPSANDLLTDSLLSCKPSSEVQQG